MNGIERTVASALGAALFAGVLVIRPSESAAVPSVGSPGAFTLTAIIRDFQPGGMNADFATFPPATPGIRSAKNVDSALDIAGKPVYVGVGSRVISEWRDGTPQENNISWCAPAVTAPPDQPGVLGDSDAGGIAGADSFSQWFRDVPGANMSTTYSFEMVQSDPGGPWVYQATSFYPIDNELFGNGSEAHNCYFTMELVCNFTYNAADNQYFWFEGDDDCWAFVDNKLVIDHGGIGASRNQRIDFNRLSLVDGQSYKLHLFLAERYQPQSSFQIKTNVAMESAGSESIFAAFD